jgi:hypothetical protein
MDVVVEAAPAIDAATHQVAYTVTVTPGEQYPPSPGDGEQP